MRRWMVLAAAGLVSAGLYVAATVRAQTEPAATEPAAPQVTPATVSPAAKAEFDAIDKAYNDLKGVTLAGSLSLDADVSGQTQKNESEFDASFAAPSLFKHKSKDDVLAGFTGDNAFVFLPRRNVYVAKTLPGEKMTPTSMPAPLTNVLSSQNPSLLMAISKEPTAALSRGYDSVDKGPDVDVDGVAHVALVMKNDSEVATVLVDPRTHLVRRFTSDLRPLMIARGADAVNKAEFVVDYKTVKVDVEPPKADAFAWAAPDGARDITNNLQELGPGGGDAAAQAMVGKPAPDFTLDTVAAGPAVTLSSLKGNVVVLDFWATWCGPCVMSMPELNAFHESTQDKKVKVVGVNVGEQKPEVAAFVDKHKLTFPIVLDPTGATAESFSVSGFPTQMVVDKAGVIRKVAIGYGGAQSDRQLRDAVDELLK